MTQKFKWTDRIPATHDFDGLPVRAFMPGVPRASRVRCGLVLSAVCSVAITAMATRVPA